MGAIVGQHGSEIVGGGTENGDQHDNWQPDGAIRDMTEGEAMPDSHAPDDGTDAAAKQSDSPSQHDTTEETVGSSCDEHSTQCNVLSTDRAANA